MEQHEYDIKPSKLEIGIGFDGVCVSDEYPKIGNNIGAIPVLKQLVKDGHKLTLCTNRRDGQELGYALALTDAVNWFKENKIELHSVQKGFGQSDIIISTKCLGSSMAWVPKVSDTRFINWDSVSQSLLSLQVMTKYPDGMEQYVPGMEQYVPGNMMTDKSFVIYS